MNSEEIVQREEFENTKGEIRIRISKINTKVLQYSYLYSVHVSDMIKTVSFKGFYNNRTIYRERQATITKYKRVTSCYMILTVFVVIV